MGDRAPPETVGRSLAVTAGVCLVCSLLVSSTALLLRPVREANRAREANASILALVETIPGVAARLGPIDAADLEAVLVDLETGETVPGDPAAHDASSAAQDPERSVALPRGRDPAGLGRRERVARVYLLREDGELRMVVLPVRGEGFQSTLRGHLALAADMETILGLSFHEHGETPGVGSFVADRAWQAQWHGKRVHDETGRVAVGVAEGRAAPGSPHEVDGVTGATWTGEGVTNLVRFWLGESGYGPFLERMTSP